jgi:hypothetical protein
MKNTCLGFPVKRGRINHRLVKQHLRKAYIGGLRNFKLMDYNRYNFKVGDIAHDCDGFNHRIGKIVPEYDNLYGTKRGKVLWDVTFYKENGEAFCHATPPKSKQEIEAWWKNVDARRSTDEWGFAKSYEEKYGSGLTIAEDGTIIRGT